MQPAPQTGSNLIAFGAMKHAVPHNLAPEKARLVAEKAWESYQSRFSQFQPTLSWETDAKANVAFRAKGIAVSGTLTLLDKAIEMDLSVPFLLKPFRKKALDVIEREIRSWVDKANRGEI